MGNRYEDTLWLGREGEGMPRENGRGYLQKSIQEYRNILQSEIDQRKDIAQDWYAENPSCPVRGEDWYTLLFTKLEHLPDHTSPQFARWSKRFEFSSFMISNIAKDPGMSSGVAAMIRQWLPCFLEPDTVAQRLTYEDFGVETRQIIRRFVYIIDNMPDLVARVLRARLKHRKRLWADCLDNRNRRMRQSLAREAAFDDFLAQSHFIENAVARQLGLFCPICRGSSSEQRPMMNTPCCHRPTHVVCVKNHFRYQDKWKTPSCSFCRQDMSVHGWNLTKVHQECFQPVFTQGAGLVPIAVPPRFPAGVPAGVVGMPVGVPGGVPGGDDGNDSAGDDNAGEEEQDDEDEEEMRDDQDEEEDEE